jgi:PAS domain S-box-containing protein
MSTAELPEAPGRLRPDDARQMLDGQVEVLELIAVAAPLGEVLTRILTSLEHLMPGARCSVLLLDREHGTLHHGAAPSLPGPYVAAIDGMTIGDGAGSCGSAAALNAPVIATDVRSDPRWVDFRHLAAEAGLQSCWSTPIEGPDGRPVGTFAVYHSHPHCPSEREQLLVDRFTHLASVAIDHAGVVGDLVESEERFRRSFDDNSLGMAIVGLDRTVAAINGALTRLALGPVRIGSRATGSGLVGMPLAELITPTRGSLAARLDLLDDDDTAPVVFEAALHRADRADVAVEVTLSPLHARDGERAQYVVNVFDLTERRAAEQHRRARLEAETARRTAEQMLNAKSEMLAAVGHEARTPMQAIVGFTELLGTMDLDEARRREALTHIGAAAGHVMDLLTDVLDLSRLEAGALPLTLEPVPVREVVEEVFALVSSAAERRGSRCRRCSTTTWCSPTGAGCGRCCSTSSATRSDTGARVGTSRSTPVRRGTGGRWSCPSTTTDPASRPTSFLASSPPSPGPRPEPPPRRPTGRGPEPTTRAWASASASPTGWSRRWAASSPSPGAHRRGPPWSCGCRAPNGRADC